MILHEKIFESLCKLVEKIMLIFMFLSASFSAILPQTQKLSRYHVEEAMLETCRNQLEKIIRNFQATYN